MSGELEHIKHPQTQLSIIKIPINYTRGPCIPRSWGQQSALPRPIPLVDNDTPVPLSELTLVGVNANRCKSIGLKNKCLLYFILLKNSPINRKQPLLFRSPTLDSTSRTFL